MKVAEMFLTLQGEGTRVGRPVVFIRLSGCNLRCSWCDTPFASWDPQGKEMSIDEIVLETDALLGDRNNDVVISGGEPLMFKDIEQLCWRFEKDFRHTTIETAGTIWKNLDVELYSVSPKFANSFPDPIKYPNENSIHVRNLKKHPIVDFITELKMTNHAYQMKFVIQSSDDLAEVTGLVAMCNIPSENVFLMPEGKTRDELHKHRQVVVDACIQFGYTYTTRLHIDLWNDRRGV